MVLILLIQMGRQNVDIFCYTDYQRAKEEKWLRIAGFQCLMVKFEILRVFCVVFELVYLLVFSEVRVEGLETLDYLDNLQNKERFTEQGDAITFESEVDKIYVSTPTKIAILDHEKKRTFVIRKDGLPDAGEIYPFLVSLLKRAGSFWNPLESSTLVEEWKILEKPKDVHTSLHIDGRQGKCVEYCREFQWTLSSTFSSLVVWNPWDKKAKAMADFGDDEYKHMLCVEAAAVEKPITLKPGEEWRGRQELSAVPSSYCSGQLDPQKVLQCS
ncbi:putative glucose-6-phosphate 1-epimerase [Vitis vinifera]|uniref:Putative glucose-6-phosphate 1-epimerase n=1 Tax=Vitis vinifera TaxID=29760 RepID=A0A438H8K8_VITVI|nr:putative glucose-6-phosphate 1-epimerase [Vitis vinifera]